MAEPLKNRYGPEVPAFIADQIQAVYPSFDRTAFLRDVLDGFESLELMPRARHICQALKQHLPTRFADALSILMDSLGACLTDTRSFGMTAFRYLPHVYFVSTYGPPSIHAGHDDFERCMAAQYELTQRFTAEFSLRAFLTDFPDATLATLAVWATDANEHVRRAVSEGTRPRLPWATRLPAFQRDPSPVITLLDQLKDDPSRYVQRSVANNLNDISKDNPDAFYATVARWQAEWDEMDPAQRQGNRDWIIRHALRTAIKRGENQAFALSGCGPQPKLAVDQIEISPSHANTGDEVQIRCTLKNLGDTISTFVADLAVDYPKANGKHSRKVFKLKKLTLTPATSVSVSKRISLRNMTTRKHYPGSHPVFLLVNGQAHPLGTFELSC